MPPCLPPQPPQKTSRVLPETAEGRLLNLIEMAKAHIRAKGEHPFRVVKQQFSFQKTKLRGMAKNRCKVHVSNVDSIDRQSTKKGSD